MIDLYTWTTPNGEKPVIMLEECGVDYDLHLVDISTGEQKKSDFLAINPNGRIPALVDDGVRVFESGAILVHLAAKTGRFLPADAAARAEVLSWTFFQIGGTGPMIGQWHHFNSAAPEKIPYAIERYATESRRLLGVLDERLSANEFLAGDYSIADMINVSWARSGLNGLKARDTFPSLARWVDAIDAREPVRRALDRLKTAREALKA
ncbi:glutathione S-transferase N-terminal domain-containing protein [Aureimonas mangrovi]|uniref:glutathione S-transferase N-terminal domain-containing protein n=1 Tax=Aureimonas mangrovi TaxID=2758041 RepID=UPI00163DB6E1|nr:glutathione S-transferase N-terminal domain-containing protein [Aureimonas mangrovi]